MGKTEKSKFKQLIIFMEGEEEEKEYKILKKTITVTEQESDLGTVKQFPLLYKLNKGNKNGLRKKVIKDYFVIENKLYIISGQEEGKKITHIKLGVVKNKGKKNEVNEEMNALFQAATGWKKDYEDKEYECDTDIEAVIIDTSKVAVQTPVEYSFRCELSTELRNIRPTLALKYEEHKDSTEEVFGISRKIDGVRAVAQVYRNIEGSKIIDGEGGDSLEIGDEKGNYTILTSRNGKKFGFLSQIKEEIAELLDHYCLSFPENKGDPLINLILDGEIYSHNIPFNEIVGIAKRIKTPGDESKMEYWIFDIIDEKRTYLERIEIMKKLEKIAKMNNLSHIKFIFYEEGNSEDDVKRLHEEYVSNGYEGVMIRNLNSVYMTKYRGKE